MDEQLQFSEAIPQTGTFLTATNPSLTHSPQKQTSESNYRPIEDWLEAEARAVKQRKERDAHKQARLKEIEAEFQRQRSKKQREIEEKLAASQKIKQKTLEQVQQKCHRISSRHRTIIAKIHQEQLKELQQHIDQRKAYDFEPNTHSKYQTNDPTPTRPRQKATIEETEIDRRMREIDERLSRAKSLSREQRLGKVNRSQQHNVDQIRQAQRKASQHWFGQEQQLSQQVAIKLEGVDAARLRLEREAEQRQEARHKTQSEKLRKVHDNRIQLQEEQVRMSEQLALKLQKTTTTLWSRPKAAPLHRLADNLQVLQREQAVKADQTMQKHQEMALRNRLYRQRKEQLYQSLRQD